MGVDTADTEYTWKAIDYVVLHFIWKLQSVGISLRIGCGLKCPTSKAKHREDKQYGRKCIKEWMELDLNSAKREDKKDAGQMARISWQQQSISCQIGDDDVYTQTKICVHQLHPSSQIIRGV